MPQLVAEIHVHVVCGWRGKDQAFGTATGYAFSRAIRVVRQTDPGHEGSPLSIQGIQRKSDNPPLRALRKCSRTPTTRPRRYKCLALWQHGADFPVPLAAHAAAQGRSNSALRPYSNRLTVNQTVREGTVNLRITDGSEYIGSTVAGLLTELGLRMVVSCSLSQGRRNREPKEVGFMRDS
jgi:hypothetical protein